MKPEAMRIAIAELCPSVFVRPVGSSGWNYYNSNVDRILPCINGNPLIDLNACAEMRKCVPEGKRRDYADTLNEICIQQSASNQPILWTAIDAKPEQHCETFLRVMGGYKE